MSDSCICVSEYTGIHTTTLTLQINTAANTDTEDTADTCLFTKLTDWLVLDWRRNKVFFVTKKLFTVSALHIFYFPRLQCLYSKHCVLLFEILTLSAVFLKSLFSEKENKLS